MKSRLTNVVLTGLTLVLLFLFALAVPSGRLTEEADARYREEQSELGEDSWLLQYTDNTKEELE